MDLFQFADELLKNCSSSRSIEEGNREIEASVSSTEFKENGKWSTK